MKKGTKAPCITSAYIDNVIISEQYHVFKGMSKIACSITLKYGFTITAESSAASLDTFNIKLLRKMARKNARKKIIALERIRVKEKII